VRGSRTVLRRALPKLERKGGFSTQTPPDTLSKLTLKLGTARFLDSLHLPVGSFLIRRLVWSWFHASPSYPPHLSSLNTCLRIISTGSTQRVVISLGTLWQRSRPTSSAIHDSRQIHHLCGWWMSTRSSLDGCVVVVLWQCIGSHGMSRLNKDPELRWDTTRACDPIRFRLR
jgi:hypothetical protein